MLFFLLAVHATGQTGNFDSGSDESYRIDESATDAVVHITENTTLDVPADGIFNLTALLVDSNRTLTFNRNARNTPVYILATGPIVIEGTVHVNGEKGSNVAAGRGGPGGFDGGAPGNAGIAPGDGSGPGGGAGGENNTTVDAAGSGSYGSVSVGGVSTRNGAAYGSPILIPMLGGSGGGGAMGEPGLGG